MLVRMTNESDTSIQRWGGLASIGGGLLFILVFAWVIILAGPDPAGPARPITKFPQIKAVRTLENGLYLAVLVLWVPVYLALYRRLAKARPAPALVGGTLGILGLGVLAAGAIPHAATSRLSDLYHAAGATAEDQATLVLIWQGTQGIFERCCWPVCSSLRSASSSSAWRCTATPPSANGPRGSVCCSAPPHSPPGW
jgi:hypothetical protein